MNLQLLKTFLAVVEPGNLNRAAEALHNTQSTVYTRLNNLEQELGQVLFHRRNSDSELTTAGFRFERSAQFMTNIWRKAQQETVFRPEPDRRIADNQNWLRNLLVT
jgi:DNA-binding transcriptional LysR family regulator